MKLKPGTPLMFSLLEGRPVLSLSGNPFAAAATFELLARPLLAALAGQRDWQPAYPHRPAGYSLFQGQPAGGGSSGAFIETEP